MLGGETVSLVTGCMNRISSLLVALPTWLGLGELDEIVIVDWNSSEGVRDAVAGAGLKDPRLQFYWVSDADFWDFPACANLGIGMARSARILRTDADIRILPGFFDDPALAELTRDEFWTGCWSQARDDNEKHLNGTIYAHRETFWTVNGYNERLIGYGFEDEDLYTRLFRAGFGRRFLDHDRLAHLSHDDDSRVVCAPETPVRSDDIRFFLPFTAGETATQRLSRSNMYNRKLVAHAPWTMADHRATWTAAFLNKNHWWCRRRA